MGATGRLGVVVAFMAVLALAWPAQSQNRPNLVGFYEVKEATDLGPEVSVSLLVRLVHASDPDLAQAEFSLRDPLRRTSYGSFAILPARSPRWVELRGEFTVPRREIERWQVGARPYVVVEFPGPGGSRVLQPVRLLRRPLRTER